MKTGSLRELIRAREFLHMPAVYDPLGGLLVQNSGFKVCFATSPAPRSRFPSRS